MSERFSRFQTSHDGLKAIVVEHIALPDYIRTEAGSWVKKEGYTIDGDIETNLTLEAIDNAMVAQCLPTEECYFLDARRGGENVRIAIKYQRETGVLAACVRYADVSESTYASWQHLS